MENWIDFDKEYFLQTRKEIDTEKRERDLILNFAVIVLGALAFAVVQSDKAASFLAQPSAFFFELAALVILTTLFWVRRKKLQQISDRWYTLYKMVMRHFGKDRASETMEAVVMSGFGAKRYAKKDVALNLALSSPVYILLFESSPGLTGRTMIGAMIAVAAIIAHVGISLRLLAIRMKDPFDISVAITGSDKDGGVGET